MLPNRTTRYRARFKTQLVWLKEGISEAIKTGSINTDTEDIS